MQHLSIPTCFFPSTTLFIDDNRDFLLNFVLQLDERVAYRIFDDPNQALNHVYKKNCDLELLNHHCLSEFKAAKSCSVTNHTVNLDLAAIHAEVYNPNRFSEISVMVVDYAMPGMNGLEFCRRLDNNHIKKILLTGQADEQLAIEAFHEGLIHRYIKKNDPHAAEMITRSLYELQLEYFQAMSETIVRMLSVRSPSCLNDKKFVQFFKTLCEEKRITEYYLIDHSGSFMMLDDDANINFLIMRNERDLEVYQTIARRQDADEATLDKLVHGTYIPGLWRSKTPDLQWSECLEHLVPATRFVGNETYYYAYLKEDARFNLRQSKILSYSRYLEELDAEALLI